jgi:transposase
MPDPSVALQVLLPELRLLQTRRGPRGGLDFMVEKTSKLEVCPRCASPSRSVYDRRWVTIRDEPLRKAEIRLLIHKRRFSCRPCGKPFTEPVDGVRKGYRTTQRYRQALWDAAEEFVDLKTVRRRMRCSSGLLHRVVYEQLELRRRTRLYQWPHKIGIDEHFFRRDKRLDTPQFVTMIVDHKGHRLMEVVEGKRSDDISAALAHIPGRENVRFVALDLCDSYKRFAKGFFPNAQLVADKFHVLRLISPAICRYRRLVAGTRDNAYLRRLLLRNRRSLKPWWRTRLMDWLREHPALHELYEAKEALHRFYRIRGHARAKKALTRLTDSLALSTVPELQTLRRTLLKWRKEILAYFYSGRLTNARTEGFNAKAKLVKRRAYGYRNFANYRLRLLNACRG